jgi:hypothetical protein
VVQTPAFVEGRSHGQSDQVRDNHRRWCGRPLALRGNWGDLSRLSIRFEPDLDLSKAVADTDLMRESGPENGGSKQHIWVEIELHGNPDALFISFGSILGA